MYVLTLLDPSEGTTSGFSMKAASDGARLLKKVAANHRQPLTSKPAFPDWTRDAWLLIFAFTLFVFCSSLYRFCLSAFLSCFPLSVPPPLFLATPPSRFFYPSIFQATTPLLNFFISPPPALLLSAFHLSPLPGHHRYYPSRQPSLGPSAHLFSAFSQTQLGSETKGMRVLVKSVERKTLGVEWMEDSDWVSGFLRER